MTFDLRRGADRKALHDAAYELLKDWRGARRAEKPRTFDSAIERANRAAQHREAATHRKANERARSRARQWARIQGDSYIYVIAGSPDGPTKIGITQDPEKRLRGLQTGHPERLAVYAERQVRASVVRQIEGECHRRLKDVRSQGEWFEMTAEQAERIVDQVIASFGCETYA